MVVDFNPAISFKSDTNLIANAIKNQQKQQSEDIVKAPSIDGTDTYVKKLPDEELTKMDKEIKAALEEGRSVEGIIKGTHWEKVYNKFNNTIHMKIPNSYDGNEYTLYSDGKVVVTNGWGKNEVEMEANEKMAKYFEQIKNGKTPKVNSSISDVAQQAELTEGELLKKVTDFQDRFQSRKWEKKFLPESDIIFIRQKKMTDGTEYILEKDGTVKEVGLRTKSIVLMEPNSRMAEEFNKIKARETSTDEKSLWYDTKNVIADVMKFFSMLGTMIGATAKGALCAAGTGIGVIMAATILRTPKLLKEGVKILDIYKHPAASAGKTGKIIAGVGALAMFAGHIIAGKLRANQDTAVIEHKFRVDHRDH